MKNKLTTRHYILIVFIIFGIITLYSYSYNYRKFYRKHLNCEYISDVDTYQESFKFTYNKKKMILFTRKEIILTEDEKYRAEIKEMFEALKSDYEENNVKCEYSLKEKKDRIIITTKIDVENNESVFNKYFEEQKLDNTMDAETMQYKLSNAFKCTIKTEA